MRSFSKLGLTLLVALALAFSLLCLAVGILGRGRRRRQKRPLSGDAELGCKGASFKEPAALNFLCRKIQSRVEPAGDSPAVCNSGDQQVKISPVAAAAEDVDEECVLAMWRAATFVPSRVLYTIKEEEREGLEFEEREEDDLFSTPCDSPAFYTPASSPARAPEKEAPEKEAGVSVRISPAAEEGFGIS